MNFSVVRSSSKMGILNYLQHDCGTTYQLCNVCTVPAPLLPRNHDEFDDCQTERKIINTSNPPFCLHM